VVEINITPDKILVTGASGFVGRALCAQLFRPGCEVLAAVRNPAVHSELQCERVAVGDIGQTTDWLNVLRGVKFVVHLAARVHVMVDNSTEPLAAFRQVNVEGTLNLARQAATSGVRRFIYLSSIKVNGEATESFCSHLYPDRKRSCFREDDNIAPQDGYALSKWEAEQGLWRIAQETAMEIVIIRPPLVYGPGVKANFLTMMQWLYKGVPLPLGAIHNKRSLVALDNLMDLIVTCLDHPAAANQVFLAGDGEDLSTPDLLRRLGSALGKPARLLPVPVSLLKVGAAILGRRNIAHRLCESLQVDISKARNVLGWKPPISVDEGLRQTAQSFLAALTK
jgi:nucleoside-diphosphate-sugar epimerase